MSSIPCQGPIIVYGAVQTANGGREREAREREREERSFCEIGFAWQKFVAVEEEEEEEEEGEEGGERGFLRTDNCSGRWCTNYLCSST